MSDVIATIWDFDKTLISGYMQDPMFNEYRIDPVGFWNENEKLIAECKKGDCFVNADTFYLNLMLRYVRDRRLQGLSNEKLKSYGKEQKFYEGAIDLLREIKNLTTQKPYSEYGIKFENYIVSTGLRKVIEGTVIAPYVEKIWGCDFLENAGGEIEEIAYSIDNTTKTRALFEINKGVGIAEYKNSKIDVNTKIDEAERRVQFVNMIYVADGPSDVPAFSVINQKGGATFAVYPEGDEKAMSQVEDMRCDGRVQMYAEADYRKGKTAYMWIMQRLKGQAQKLIDAKQAEIDKYKPGTPRHLIEK